MYDVSPEIIKSRILVLEENSYKKIDSRVLIYK